MVSFLFSVYLGKELLDSIVTVFWKFSKWLCHFALPPAIDEGSIPSTSSLAPFFIFLFIAILVGCWMVSDCDPVLLCFGLDAGDWTEGLPHDKRLL
jgi:hypothetical protein